MKIVLVVETFEGSRMFSDIEEMLKRMALLINALPSTEAECGITSGDIVFSRRSVPCS